MVTLVKVPRFLALMKNYASKPTITKWMKNDGEAAKAHEPLLVVESTKATLEIEAPEDGLFFPLKKLMDRVKIGDTVGVMAGSKEEYDDYRANLAKGQAS
jgi:pyruvate/2-oxoglutarate dehydrogenase complex dihydrolipoamide acyltransferase (E2) component